MKKIKDKSKIYMILGISFLVLAVLGSAYAYYKYVIATINVDTITRGLDYYINYTKGTNITSAALNPGSDYTSGNNLSVTLYKKDNTYTIYGHIYIDISSISDGLSNSGALKYTVLEGTTKIADGQLTGTTSGDTVPLAVNIPLKTTSTKYTVYLWLDENAEDYMYAENTSISAIIRCEASMKPISANPYGTTGEYFYKIYSPNTKVINNGITYNYDTTNSLMQDIGGNLRYYGATPNNYIYFNCSTYLTTNCELWRIIGTFGDKIKIVRNESIGKYPWDNKDKTTGAETNYGKNDWTDARLMKLLNPGYDNESVGGSLYYNAKSGTCYVNQNNATTACNFTSTGIKNDTTKNIIAEVTYNTAGYNDATLYPNEIYTYERGSTVYSGRQTTWTGKIGLMYPSDYGYASDLTKCREKINNYNASTCSQNNWIYNMGSLWLLTHDSARSDRNWSINSSGNASVNGNGNGGTSNSLLVFPSLFLSSDVKIISGNGSINNPYQLGV